MSNYSLPVEKIFNLIYVIFFSRLILNVCDILRLSVCQSVCLLTITEHIYCMYVDVWFFKVQMPIAKYMFINININIIKLTYE